MIKEHFTPDKEQGINKLNAFVQNWEKRYLEMNKAIPLFDTKRTSALTQEQKQLFLEYFYHISVHSYFNFVWQVGSYSPSQEYKAIIIDKLCEIAIGDKPLHKKWLDSELTRYAAYRKLAESLSVDIIYGTRFHGGRIIVDFDDSNLPPFIRKFIRGRIKWLLTHDWDHKWAAFSAHEKVDNADSKNLYRLAVNITPDHSALQFFRVYGTAKYYDQASSLLEQSWQRNPEAVRNGFRFIRQCKAKMWRDLSEAVFTPCK